MQIEFPVTISLFGYSLLIHPVLEWIGIFLGMRLYAFLKKNNRSNLSSTQSLSIIIGALIGALIGSKIIGTLENLWAIFEAKNPFLYFWTSNTIVGGLAFGILGVECTKKIIKYNESTGDLMVYPLILAMIIGRIGCFLTGVFENTFGNPTDFIFGMYLGDSHLRHPVALYEIVFLICFVFINHYISKNIVFPSGFLFQFFMLNYFTFRFFLDFIKPKLNIILNLSTIQLTCLTMILYYVTLINKNRKLIYFKR